MSIPTLQTQIDLSSEYEHGQKFARRSDSLVAPPNIFIKLILLHRTDPASVIETRNIRLPHTLVELASRARRREPSRALEHVIIEMTPQGMGRTLLQDCEFLRRERGRRSTTVARVGVDRDHAVAVTIEDRRGMRRRRNEEADRDCRESSRKMGLHRCLLQCPKREAIPRRVWISPGVMSPGAFEPAKSCRQSLTIFR